MGQGGGAGGGLVGRWVARRMETEEREMKHLFRYTEKVGMIIKKDDNENNYNDKIIIMIRLVRIIKIIIIMMK